MQSKTTEQRKIMLTTLPADGGVGPARTEIVDFRTGEIMTNVRAACIQFKPGEQAKVTVELTDEIELTLVEQADVEVPTVGRTADGHTWVRADALAKMIRENGEAISTAGDLGQMVCKFSGKLLEQWLGGPRESSEK